MEAVLKAPRPCNVAELRSFLGLVNYYNRFLPNLSTVVHPLNQLLENNHQWKWTNQCETAFYNVKEMITSEQVLTHYDPSKCFTITAEINVLQQVLDRCYRLHFISTQLNIRSLLQKQDKAIFKKVKQHDNHPLKVCLPREKNNLTHKLRRESCQRPKINKINFQIQPFMIFYVTNMYQVLHFFNLFILL